MSLGHQLVKEQLFFRQELKERVYWFIKLRWIALACAFCGSGVFFFFNPGSPVLPFTTVLLVILLYNILFCFIWLRLKSYKSYTIIPFEIFAHLQIVFDLAALFCLIYFTGGIYSPLLLFVIFHIILAGILLAPVCCFIYAGLVILAFGILMVLQKTNLVPFFLFRNPLSSLGLEFFGILFLFLTFSAFILISAFLITSIKLSLRAKGRELLKVSKELSASNTKLKTLYEMVEEMGNLYDLQALMDAATRSATVIMGVKGCSIKLLDSQGKKLKFSSIYGISEDYLAKEAIDIEKSSVNQKIIKGEPLSIGEIDKKNFFQYPEDLHKEGIASMLCLPLCVEKTVLGVFCIYSEKPHCFETDDVAFFSLMADLTALGIKNITREVNKTWFLAKASHQLRSPLNAIFSMLDLLQKEYQGPMNLEQKEVVNRCKTRVNLMGDMISDLLIIGKRRMETKESVLSLVDVKTLLENLTTLYVPRAWEKNVSLKLEMDDGVPQMNGDKQLLDDLFSNLISNAIKYTPPKGKVQVVLSAKNNRQIQFQVSDTGIGIPEEDLSKIFSEFFRSENARSFTENGTGLGLIIVKEALDLLKGTLSVESKIGEGTRIICLFPIASFGDSGEKARHF